MVDSVYFAVSHRGSISQLHQGAITLDSFHEGSILLSQLYKNIPPNMSGIAPLCHI